MDCITDLDDNQSQLLEALQLSLPVEAAGSRKKWRDKKLSLNPIYRQVPRVVDLCCQHLERHGMCRKKSRSARKEDSQHIAARAFFSDLLPFLQKCISCNLVNSIILILATTSPLKASSSPYLALETVGIFRIGSSKKRVRQVRCQPLAVIPVNVAAWKLLLF